MKEKSAFFKGWLRFWSFIASLFCDQAGSMSQKRVIPLGAFIMLWKLADKILLSKELIVNVELMTIIIYALVLTILGGIGLSIPEWFSPKAKQKLPENV